MKLYRLIILALVFVTAVVSSAEASMAGFPGRMGPKRGAGASASFSSPASYSPMLNWTDVSILSSVTKDASNTISQINDQSGNAYNLTSSGVLKPTYTANDGDGSPTITFPLGTQLKNATSTVAAAESFFAVLKYTGTAGSISGTAGTLITRGSGTMSVSTTANSFGWTVAGSVDGTSGLRNAPNPISGSYIILSGVRTSATDLYFGGVGNTGTIELWENGAYLKRTTHTGGSVSTALFAGRDNSNNAAAMSLREYILYGRALNTTERLNVENYLNKKWSVYNNFAGRRNYNDGLQRYFTRTGTTSPTGSFPLLVLSGQSNAGGEAQTTSLSLPLALAMPISGALIYSPTTAGDWATLMVGVNNQPNSNPSNTLLVKHGMELSLMYDMVHDISSPTYILKSFQGGTGLADRWMPNLDKTSNLWRTREDLVELARYNAGYNSGIDLPVKADIWYQGEQDASESGANVANYGTNEQTMIAQTRSFRINQPVVPWISVKISPSSVDSDAVNAAKTANVSAVSRYMITPGYDTQSPVGGPHGDSTSQIKIGNQVGALLSTTTHIP